MSGERLLGFARLWFSPAVVSNVFEPLAADWLHARSLAATTSRWRLDARWTVAFLSTVAQSAPRALMMTPGPAGTVGRGLTSLVVSASVISGVLLLPFLIELRSVTPTRLALLLLMLLPSILASASFPLLS